MFKEVIQVKKVVSVLLAAGIIATTGAFAENAGVSSPAASPVASPVAGAVSSIIDFADGGFGFLGMDTTLGNADASELSVVDYNGGKALCVSPAAAGRVPYVSLNVEGLLGENLSRLAKITFDVGVELGTDGKFYAQSGKVYMVNGEDGRLVGLHGTQESEDGGRDRSCGRVRGGPRRYAAILQGSGQLHRLQEV